MTAREEAYRLLERGSASAAVATLTYAGDAGDASSLLELGVWFLEGRYVPRDLRRSRESFRRAGELGDVAAEHIFVRFLANGIGGQEDWIAARERLRNLAARDEGAAVQLSRIEAISLTDEGYPLTKPEPARLSSSPDAWIYEALFTSEECRYLIECAEPLLQQSVIVDPGTGQMRPHPIRTSDGAAFPWVSEDLVISALNRRIAVASGTDVKCGEPLQVLRYRPGQQYRPHLDALPTNENQRVLTMLVYLNDEYIGGETRFVHSQIDFAGKPGDALLFRNAEPGGLPDPKAEHAGLPVTSGVKFVASRWIREKPLMGG